MIKIVLANDRATVRDFFGEQWDKQSSKDELHKYGRFIEIKGEKKGFYAIVPVLNEKGWLRTLYFTEQLNAGLLMVLIDWIKEDAAQSGYQQLMVYSHNSSTDTLFQTWGFEKMNQNEPLSVDEEGNWWISAVELSRDVDKYC
ncbi:hypothetical protein [Salinibacillus xinjiangensis]|uniref:N-acetyltransferase domain-containing protein n=1 Tax=Salinibacillus xinjiangensis TaxID=1229268 RepID=A0A6G1X5D5_9BACI|nr:hypothetical protein [Salinibacillus xinjiangensis]MRG86213.1 hypothetical protein [Salinibacillus xinjiangensis]